MSLEKDGNTRDAFRDIAADGHIHCYTNPLNLYSFWHLLRSAQVDVVSEIYIKDNTEPFSGKTEDISKRMKDLNAKAVVACGGKGVKVSEAKRKAK